MSRAAARSGHLSRDLDYRPDIDGLRAVAVMLVVLNHAGAAALPGGFVGVDVFFVISGFLITGLIVRQNDRGDFGFGRFYLRRARRLLPALFAMMLATLGAGWFLLIPSDYSLLAESALSAVALASNVFFWLTSEGYFAPDATTQPLLHVWSLSVEEQFYLVWPGLLLLALRLPSSRLRIALVAVLAAAAFGWAQYGVWRGWTSAYFLLPARAGEFLLGALAWMLWRARTPNPALANAASLLGLALIALSAGMLDADSAFPGLTALAPCLGAVLIVCAPQFGPSAVTAALATRPAVGIGLISYSVYLWHWPIVAYLRLARIEFTPPITAGVVLASLALGWLSWRLLERDLRGALERRNGHALALAALGVAAMVAAPLAIRQREGLPERFPFALLTQEQLTAERGRYWRELPAKDGALAGGEDRQLLIVGNSHAYDLAYAFRENGYGGRIKLIETFHECFNFGHDPMAPANAELCAERRAAVLNSPDLKAASAVYLHDNWGRLETRGLEAMIAEIRAVTPAPIHVFGPKMMFTDDVLAISRRAQAERRASVAAINDFAAGWQDPRKPEIDRGLKAFFAARALPGVRYVSTLDVQCGPALRCDILSPRGDYLYFDAGHFTLEGSRRFGERLRRRHPETF